MVLALELPPRFSLGDIVGKDQIGKDPNGSIVFTHDFPPQRGIPMYGIHYIQFEGRNNEPLATFSLMHNTGSHRLSITMTRDGNAITGLRDAKVWLDSPDESTPEREIYYVADYTGNQRLAPISDFTRQIVRTTGIAIEHNPDYYFNWFKSTEDKLQHAQTILRRMIPQQLDWYELVQFYARATQTDSLTAGQIDQNPFNPLQPPTPFAAESQS